jgi:uncharacterized protein YndB with AHSA1/START domain
MTSMQGSASVHVEAPPEKVYDLVSDVTRMGEWSPETVSCQWVGGSTGPAVGAKFKGRNKAGILRWSTTPEVTAAEPGREFAFKTSDTNWRYTFEADGSGTKVTESFDAPHYNFFLNLINPARKREPFLVEGMQTTLERIKAAAEAQ